MSFFRTFGYKAVDDSEDDYPRPSTNFQKPSSALLYSGWVTASIFAFSTAILFFRLARLTCPDIVQHSGSFSTGFSTEFNPIKPYIKEEPTMFWGGPRWYDNGTGYRVNNPSEPIYVGPPNEEMDAAWESLIKGRYLSITEEEAEMAFGKPHGLYLHPDGVGYLAGLDVFHALHCVDQLRKALDRDHYYNKQTKLGYPDRGHRDHCIDHIRQQLMCHADMTPIPVIWYEGHGRSFVQSDVVHTCRNWNSLRQYVDRRTG